MHHSSVSWEITLLFFFNWNFIWFGQKKPIKMSNFRVSTSHMKFHQICIFISPLCWKYIKFHLKSYRRFMSHDNKDWFVISKTKRTWSILTWAHKILKIFTLIGSFCAKYRTFDLKTSRGVIIRDTEERCKVWRKTNLWFGKLREEFDKFLPKHLKNLKILTLMGSFYSK